MTAFDLATDLPLTRAPSEPEPARLCSTVFRVPLLNQRSVVGGGCCPTPVEAIVEPELELVAGVEEACADWERAEVRVRHALHVDPAGLAAILEELGYPAVEWYAEPSAVGSAARGR